MQSLFRRIVKLLKIIVNIADDDSTNNYVVLHDRDQTQIDTLTTSINENHILLMPVRGIETIDPILNNSTWTNRNKPKTGYSHTQIRIVKVQFAFSTNLPEVNYGTGIILHENAKGSDMADDDSIRTPITIPYMLKWDI